MSSLFITIGDGHGCGKSTIFIDIPKILEILERGRKSQDNLDFLRKIQTLKEVTRSAF